MASKKEILAWHFIGKSKTLLDGNTVAPGYTYSVPERDVKICYSGLHACPSPLTAQEMSRFSGYEVTRFTTSRDIDKLVGHYACRVAMSGRVQTTCHGTKCVASERTVLWMLHVGPVWDEIFHITLSLAEMRSLWLTGRIIPYSSIEPYLHEKGFNEKYKEEHLLSVARVMNIYPKYRADYHSDYTHLAKAYGRLALLGPKSTRPYCYRPFVWIDILQDLLRDGNTAWIMANSLFERILLERGASHDD